LNTETVRLLISCADARGIVAAVGGFLAAHGGNIVELDQHSDRQRGRFYMRVEVELDGFALSRDSFTAAWEPTAQKFAMNWRVRWGPDQKRMAILVSREGHCLTDLLYRCSIGELRAQVQCIISNHEVLKGIAGAAGIPFHHLPSRPGDGGEQERQVRAILSDCRPDFIVLARYMQILSPAFVAAYPQRIINIHHSFLPAFAGPRPYHQAFERGVKIIGATSHYVTAELDRGPIIAQQTLSVDHRDGVGDLVRKGRDLERVVLADAVRMHIEDQILVGGDKTIVFD
jgi:formyltetrahydrofolate deformylase